MSPGNQATLKRYLLSTVFKSICRCVSRYLVFRAHNLLRSCFQSSVRISFLRSPKTPFTSFVITLLYITTLDSILDFLEYIRSRLLSSAPKSLYIYNKYKFLSAAAHTSSLSSSESSRSSSSSIASISNCTSIDSPVNFSRGILFVSGIRKEVKMPKNLSSAPFSKEAYINNAYICITEFTQLSSFPSLSFNGPKIA
jgi:hypothetical protein